MAGIKDVFSDALQKTGKDVTATGNSERVKINRMKEMLGSQISELQKQQAVLSGRLDVKEKRMSELLDELSDYIEKLSLVMVSFEQKINSYDENYAAIEKKLDQVNDTVNSSEDLEKGVTMEETVKKLEELREEIDSLRKDNVEQSLTIIEKTDSKIEELSSKLLAIKSMSDSKLGKENDDIMELLNGVKAEISKVTEAVEDINALSEAMEDMNSLSEVKEGLKEFEGIEERFLESQEEVKEYFRSEMIKNYRNMEELLQTKEEEEDDLGIEEETLEDMVSSVKKMQTANLVFAILNFIGTASIIGWFIFEVLKPTLF